MKFKKLDQDILSEYKESALQPTKQPNHKRAQWSETTYYKHKVNCNNKITNIINKN